MKTKTHPIAIAIIMLFGSLLLDAAQIPISRSFNTSDISYATTALRGTEYLIPKWGNEMINSGEIGAPALPKAWTSLAVPVNAINLTIQDITCSNEFIQQLSSHIIPVQESTPSDGRPIIKTLPDSTYYNKSGFAPSVGARITGIDTYKDICKIVTIEISPMEYNPLAKQTKAYGNISFSLKYDESDAMTMSDRAITQEDINIIKYLVANPEFITPRHKMATNTASQQPIVKNGNGINLTANLKAYEYSVITTKEFAPYFERLIALKKLHGLDAGVVCIEDILKSPLVSQGDTISHINDDAGKLRQYLNLSKGILQYALLAGIPPYIPIRYGCYFDHTQPPSESSKIDYIIPTDLEVV